jgi:hypothetical protein
MAKSLRSVNHDHGRFAAGLFAATVVVTVGVGTCLMIVTLVAPELWRPIAVILSGIAGLGLLMRALSERPVPRSADCQVLIAEREALQEHVESYRPPDERWRGGRGCGANKPPSADDIRQIRADSNAWVPSEARVQEYRKALGQIDPH